MNLERMPKAYQQGYSAFQWGDPPHKCPYGKAFELRQRCEWMAGYWDADTDMNGFRDPAQRIAANEDCYS
jgi:ribosome modulation factor